jgi:hypothetical protein
MAVPDHQVILYHLNRRIENGLISLSLPEIDIEAAFVIPGPFV